MRIISAKIIEKAMPPSLWINAMEKALLAAEDKSYFTPNRMHVDMGENTLLLMPSAGPKSFATKLVSIFPENKKLHKAAIQGMVILNDGETGEGLALLNGSQLTAMRTAAIANVGTRYLSNENTTSLGIIGAGFQGKHIAWFASEERPIEKIYLVDYSEEVIAEFIIFIKEKKPQIEVVVCRDARELLSNTSLVFTATSSSQPILPNDGEILKDKCIIGVGSYKPEMREFPGVLYPLVSEIWIDAEHGKQETGDLIYPQEHGLIDSSKIRLISNLIGKCKLTTGTRLYKTVGLATFDLFAAQLVYEKCLVENLGVEIEI